VLVAELGDKTTYTLAFRGSRFARSVFGAMSAAFAVKMVAASGLVRFGSLLLTDWGEPAQIAVAALAIIPSWPRRWGGTLALVTKGPLPMVFDMKVRAWLPQRALRPLAVGWWGLLGVLALGRFSAALW